MLLSPTSDSLLDYQTVDAAENSSLYAGQVGWYCACYNATDITHATNAVSSKVWVNLLAAR